MTARTAKVAAVLIIVPIAAGALASCAAVLGLDEYGDRDGSAAPATSADGAPTSDGSMGAQDASPSTDGAASGLEDATLQDGAVADAGSDAALEAALPPSCQQGTVGVTSCLGAQGCCTSLLVQSQTYSRQYEVTYEGPTQESAPASVSAFRLDQYEVTVGRFRNFVNAITSDAGAPPMNGSGKHVHLNDGGGLFNAGAGAGYESGWDGADWNYGLINGPGTMPEWEADLAKTTWTAGNDALPISSVTWFEAMAFCIWDGGFLPSDAELEDAEAGGDSQRYLPWIFMDETSQDPPDPTCPGGCSLAIFGCDYPNGSDGGSCGLTAIAPVGTATMGAGRWGQLDLFGNVPEWTIDRGNTDIATPFLTPCVDCADTNTGVGKGNSRIFRGGDAFSPLPSAPQRNVEYSAESHVAGIRCARPPSP